MLTDWYVSDDCKFRQVTICLQASFPWQVVLICIVVFLGSARCDVSAGWWLWSWLRNLFCRNLLMAWRNTSFFNFNTTAANCNIVSSDYALRRMRIFKLQQLWIISIQRILPQCTWPQTLTTFLRFCLGQRRAYRTQGMTPCARNATMGHDNIK